MPLFLFVGICIKLICINCAILQKCEFLSIIQRRKRTLDNEGVFYPNGTPLNLENKIKYSAYQKKDKYKKSVAML